MAVGNLEFVKNGGTSTSVASVSITDCFNDNYDVYKIVVDKQLSNVASYNLRFINSGGTTISTANYDYATLLMISNAANSESRATNQTEINGFLSVDARALDTHNGGSIFYVFNPTSSSYTFVLHQSTYLNSGSGMRGRKSIGVLKTTDDITGLYFALSTGNIENLNVNIYGVK